jgi:predicted nucleotidyltransferase
MQKPNYEGLLPTVASKIRPMVDEMLSEHGGNIHSIHLVGSAVMTDYNEKLSDVNSVVVLQDMDLRFITFLAPLGKKYGRTGIAAPLVMTPAYIRDSLDAFPIEFHDFKLIHATLFGEDLFANLEINRQHLRLQCEREIKTKQIALRQGYLSVLGKEKELLHLLVQSFTGAMALFRAIISLQGKQPPIPRAEVIELFGSCCGLETSVFLDLLDLKNARLKASASGLRTLFEQYYQALESVRKIVDEIPA